MPLKDILGHPALYRLWQAPFALQKLKPVVQSGMIPRAPRVLDVGCGPGTNAKSFALAESYIGIDISEKYVAYASKHFAGDFRVADATLPQPWWGEFDLILMNSLMHHLNDEDARRLLASLPALVAPEGEIQIVDLVLSEGGIPRRMARADRGAFPRTMWGWEALVAGELEIKSIGSFHVGVGPLALWELVHIRASVQD